MRIEGDWRRDVKCLTCHGRGWIPTNEPAPHPQEDVCPTCETSAIPGRYPTTPRQLVEESA